MEETLVAVVLFLAGFTKGLTGFGQALVAMPLLARLIGIRITSPIMSLYAFLSNIYLLFRHRRALRWSEIGRLTIASLVGVPLGVWGLRHLEERVILALLGFVLVGYSSYALFAPRLPRIRDGRWAWPFGFVAGLLGGAYNTNGPPVVIYGHSREWAPDEFKGNLQAFFLINSISVVAAHLFGGNYTPAVVRYFLAGLPFVAVGLWIGARVDRYLKPDLFRKIVLVTLAALGVSLFF